MSTSRSTHLSANHSIHELPNANDHYLSEFHQRVIREMKQKLAMAQFHISAIDCPQCRTKMVDIAIDELPLRHCRTCHGWWFDSHELMHFTELFEDTSDGDCVDRETEYPCPICHQRLHEQPLRVSSNVFVNVCPDGHGIFLDDNKFVRALEDSDRVDGLAGHLNDRHLHVWRELQACLLNGDFEPSELTCRECDERVVTLKVQGVDIDYCTQCQSCWFDAHELQRFTGESRDVPGDHLTSRETPHRCPKCQRHLRLYQFLPRTNVMVEACPASHGVYLRSGQFPRVMQASEHG